MKMIQVIPIVTFYHCTITISQWFQDLFHEVLPRLPQHIPRTPSFLWIGLKKTCQYLKSLNIGI